MTAKTLAAACGACVVFGWALASGAQAPKPGAAPVPTYTRDVAPILFKNCVGCHRPGEIGPMPLLTYDDAKAYRSEIRDEVSEGHMPPWHANAPEGTFLNERRLTAADKDTIVRWADAGAPKGDAADMPPPPTFPEGWQLGTPDLVLEMEKPFAVPASGEIAYQYFYIPTNFTETRWVKSIEVRPGVRAAVHHVLVFYRSSPDQTQPAIIRRNAEQMREPPPPPGAPRPRAPMSETERQRLIATYAPGTNPQVMPEGTALRLEAGGAIELQMHYTAYGTAAQDRTRIGIIFARDAPAREVRPTHFFNTQLVLAPGAADVRVDADVSFVAPATVWGIFPHTHLRGKKWLYLLELPDGSKKIILDVPEYDFHWQTYYMFKQPLEIPAGARLVSSAWYDNSAGNPANPDPKATVRWGDQTWDEMQYTGLLVSPAARSPRPDRLVTPEAMRK
jgi:hypothetical protein